MDKKGKIKIYLTQKSEKNEGLHDGVSRFDLSLLLQYWQLTGSSSFII